MRFPVGLCERLAIMYQRTNSMESNSKMAQQAKPFLGQIRDSLDSEAADHAESGWHEMSIDPGVDLGVQKTKALFLAPLILLLVLAGFVIQTEAAAYVEDVLDW